MEQQMRAIAEGLVPPRAIIDIGSNTVRLVVYGGPERAPAVLHNEKVTARLGKGVAETGRLSKKAAAAALAALARYRCLLDLKGVTAVEVVATAAVRDATDGQEFLARVAALGFAPRLLGGEEEALTSAMGVLGAFPDAAGVVADLGGGSLELVDVADGAASHGVSLPLGTLRLPPLRAGTHPAFLAAVRAMVAGADWTTPPGATLYLVGGSLRSFARHAMQALAWPIDDPHGFEITADRALPLARTLARRAPESLEPIPGISGSRRASLPDAAALLHALIETLRPARLVFSAWGLREGLLVGAMDPATRAADPLLAGVAAFAAGQGSAARAADAVAAWTAPVLGPADDRLRRAAATLALASVPVEPNLRAGVAADWAMRKRWIGIDARGRALLAAALVANTGRLELPKAWRACASSADLAAAQGWGLAVRLCRRMTASAPAALAASRLTREDDTLRLTVAAPCAALVNEGVERDLKALAAHLGLKPAYDTGP